MKGVPQQEKGIQRAPTPQHELSAEPDNSKPQTGGDVGV